MPEEHAVERREGGGRENFLKKKAGPLPVWGWLAVGALAIVAILWLRGRGGGGGGEATVSEQGAGQAPGNQPGPAASSADQTAAINDLAKSFSAQQEQLSKALQASNEQLSGAIQAQGKTLGQALTTQGSELQGAIGQQGQSFNEALAAQGTAFTQQFQQEQQEIAGLQAQVNQVQGLKQTIADAIGQLAAGEQNLAYVNFGGGTPAQAQAQKAAGLFGKTITPSSAQQSTLPGPGESGRPIFISQ